MFGPRFKGWELAQRVERLVLHCHAPATLIRAMLQLDQFVHNALPCARGCCGVTRLPIDAGKLPTERWAVLSFVFCGDQAKGFALFAGLEGSLFACNEVFAVVNAPWAEEYAVALFHVLFHVVNMNQSVPSPLASSGRGCLGW